MQDRELVEIPLDNRDVELLPSEFCTSLTLTHLRTLARSPVPLMFAEWVVEPQKLSGYSVALPLRQAELRGSFADRAPTCLSDTEHARPSTLPTQRC